MACDGSRKGRKDGSMKCRKGSPNNREWHGMGVGKVLPRGEGERMEGCLGDKPLV